MRIAAAGLLCTLLTIGAVAQNTIHVPADQLTIQDAINAANNGDTILVAPGTYAANLDFLGKAITITSSGGAQNTVLDGDRKGPAVQFVTGETQGSVLDGFTITHGFSINGPGAAITINNAAPTIRNNIITDNAGCTTSAVYALNGSPQLINNTISNNGQTWTNCSSYGYGAGVYLQYSFPGVQTQIIGNTIVNNALPGGSGGGLSLFQAGNAVIRNNLIKGNSSGGTGGMEIWNYSSETVVDNVIVENYSTGGGISALYINGMPNQPGMYLANNTLVGAAQDQVILQLDYYFDSVQLANNIIIGNEALAPVYCNPIYGSAPPTFANNDVYTAGSAAPYSGVCADQTGVNGNLSVDPSFLDPSHSDYRLQATSAMVDAGSNSAANLPDKDKDGNPRVVDGNNDGNPVVDIGAFELVPQSYGQNAVISPTLAQFPNQDVNTTSNPIMLTLTNTGTADLAITGISTSGPFAETNNCAQVLPVGAHCVLEVTFSPTLGGRISGSLTVRTGTVPVSAALLGTGNFAGARLSPSQINFYDVLLGYSYVQSLTLSSTGTAPLIINSIETSNPFSVIGGACTVGMSLAPGTACDIQVQFTPTQAIAYTGGIIVSTTAPNPLSSIFSGSGAAPLAAVSPVALFFSPQLVGTSSAAQAVTFSNAGNSLLTISQISISAPFSQINNCGSYLVAGSSCTILVTYSPLLRQTDSGSLLISHNAAGGSSTVQLSGTGVGPVLSLSPTTLSFSSQLVGTTSAPQAFTVSNTGEMPLSLTAIATSGAFSETNNCPSSLAAGLSCTVQVTFSPVARGTAAGSVVVSAIAPASGSNTVSLNGNGIGPLLSVSPSNLSFSRQLVGTTSAPQSLIVSNIGDAPLSLTTISTSGPFSETNNCQSSLDVGSSCTVQVAFSPVALGTATGSVLVSVPLPTGPKTMNLSGTGFIEVQNGIHVPADQPTIQSAINVASAGDTVVVAPGTYFEHIRFTGKPITVTSSDGAATTIIDGGGVGSVVTFNQNEPEETVLTGFTIQNGRTYDGSAIYIYGGSPRITGNVISNNRGGDAIYVDNSSALIQGNTISNNVQDMSGAGGAIYIASTDSVNSNVGVIGNVITDNHYDHGAFGGGISIGYYTSVLIQNNYIAGNSAFNGGGGIAAGSHAPTIITGNIITNNSSGPGGDGGALLVNGPGALLVLNNTLYGNSSNYSGTSEIATTTYPVNSTFKNNIIYATRGNAISCPSTGGTLVATKNIIFSVSPATNGNCPAFAEANGNILANPGMVNPASGDFHLQNDSLAVDAGASDPNLPPADLDQHTRVLDGNNDGTVAVDIGAYELVPTGYTSGWGTLTPLGTRFPVTVVGSSSGPMNFTLSNVGHGPLNVGLIAVTGAFSESHNCPAILAVNEACLIQVTFTPTTDGRFSGTLSAATDGISGTVTVPLSGTGNGVFGTITPGSLDFGSVTVGSLAARQLIVSNTGTGPLMISSFSFTGPFSISGDGCSGVPLPPGATCRIGVAFRPTALGAVSGTLVANSNAAALIPRVLSLSGSGDGPVISVAPANLSFGAVPEGNNQTQVVTVSNTGGQALTISAIQTSANFTQTNNCGSSIAAGTSCSINVIFAPSATQAYAGTLTISSNTIVGSSTSTVSLSGSGTPPAILLSASSLAFGSQLLGTTSAAQTITVSNRSDIAVPINAVAITSGSIPFSQTNNCGTSLAAHTTCTINVTFAPTAYGAASSTLTVYLAPAPNQSVALSGTGIGPKSSLSPTTLAFPSQLVGTTSAPQTLTLSNPGTAALSISSIVTYAPFAQTNNCGTSLDAGASCTINVTFTPTSRGSASSPLIVTVGWPASNQTITLTGSGIGPVGSFSPSSVTFPLQRVNATSSPQVVTFSNTGDTVLTISSIATAGAIVFAQTNNCPATLAPSSSCLISVTFRPVQTGGAYYGDVVVTDDSGGVSGTQQQALLTGTGGASTATPSPSSLTFANTRVGTSTTPATVTISNNGTMSLNISSISTSGDFSQSNNCGTVVATGASCVVNVVFTPSATGTRNGSLTINSDAQFYNSESMSLSGTGVLPVVSVAPGSLTFGTIPVGTQSSVSAVTLSNTGSAPMSISSIASTGDFVQSNNCPTTLAAGSSCTISVIFAPSAGGTRTGVLTITDDASSGSQTVSLSGSATDFSVVASPTSVGINAGQSANYNAKVSAVGGVFNQSVSLTCAGLPVAATCTFTPVSVIPGSTSQTSKLKITTSNGGTPKGTYTIVVSGVVNNVVRTGTATLIVK